MKKASMKAVVCTRYGSPDFLKVRHITRPTPGSKEIRIKVYASAVTAADTMMRRAIPKVSKLFLGWNKPKKDVMGTGFAGIVEAVGKEVSKWRVGDQVFGEAGLDFGANAEYLVMPEDGVIMKKPLNISFEAAATICDGPLTSLNFLKELGQIQAGDRVLINGASGALGTAAVQLAKYYGAHVTGVCGPSNIAMVAKLGADRVLDYTKVDFTEEGKTYDIIYDTVGKSSFAKAKKALAPTGRYLSPVLDLQLLFQMIWTSKFSKKKALFSATGLMPSLRLREMGATLSELIATEQLKIVVDKVYQLDDAAAAHRYVDSGHKRGNVVLVA
ncbi:MAG: NAD(P)-dependent alcohol dehydrogenase [Bacteroidota bacterium]